MEESKKNKLPLLLGIAGGISLLVAAFAVYFLVFSGPAAPRTDPKKRQPVVHRVGAGTSGGLTEVLQKAKGGDSILLEGNIWDARVEINIPNLTIEAASGRKVTWFPRETSRIPRGSPLLLISNVSGFQLRNVTLDGENKAETLISCYGKCHGTLLDKVELKNATKCGIIFSNCAGTAESPVRLTEVAIATLKPAETAIHFTYNSSFKELMRIDSHFDLRQVTFAGPGHKVTTPKFVTVDKKPVPNAEFLDRSTIKLPEGVSFTEVP